MGEGWPEEDSVCLFHCWNADDSWPCSWGWTQGEAFKGNLVSLHRSQYDTGCRDRLALHLGRWGPWGLLMFEGFSIHIVKWTLWKICAVTQDTLKCWCYLFVESFLTCVASPCLLSLLLSGLSVQVGPRCLWGSTFVAMETDWIQNFLPLDSCAYMSQTFAKS